MWVQAIVIYKQMDDASPRPPTLQLLRYEGPASTHSRLNHEQGTAVNNNMKNPFYGIK